MSMFVIVKMTNGTIVMSDSALSTGEKHEKRIGLVDDKCFITNNGDLVALTGNMGIVKPLKGYIKAQDNLDFDKLLIYVNSLNNELISIHPERESKQNLIMFIFKDNCCYQIANNENGIFKISKNDSQITFAGHYVHDEKVYNSQEVADKINELLQPTLRNKHIIDCMTDVMKFFNCPAVGGVARFYLKMNGENKFKNISNIKIDNIPLALIDGNLKVNGNTVLGGNITFETHDPLIGDAINIANSAEVLAKSASGNIKKLADGTYTGGTFINGTRIEAPEIYGGQIFGGEFRDLSGKSKLVLNPSNYSGGNADLNLYSGNNIAFKIYDEITGSINLSSFGNLFLKTGEWGTFPQGKWDFSNAEVTGLKSGAIFY